MMITVLEHLDDVANGSESMVSLFEDGQAHTFFRTGAVTFGSGMGWSDSPTSNRGQIEDGKLWR